MNRHVPARQKLADAPLTAESIAATLKSTLPRRNNYKPTNYAELLEELAQFGIHTRRQLRALMLRHRRKIIDADRGPFDRRSVTAMRSELGDSVFADLSRRQLFWTWEGLTRLALECEFGARYAEYQRQRSGA